MEILVLFNSKGGNTYALAKAIAEGIEQVPEVTARIRRPAETTPMEVIRSMPDWSQFYDRITAEVKEVTIDDLVETEGLAIGSPTRYGNISPTMGNFLERTGSLWASGALAGKTAGVFASTNTMHGGNEATLLGMMVPLMHLGYIIVPMGYTDRGVMSTERGGTPYGPSSVSGLGSPTPTDVELQIAKAYGTRLANITKKLRS